MYPQLFWALQTDGVEHNIYIGTPLQEKGNLTTSTQQSSCGSCRLFAKCENKHYDL